jgi:hypothetical protein
MAGEGIAGAASAPDGDRLNRERTSAYPLVFLAALRNGAGTRQLLIGRPLEGSWPLKGCRKLFGVWPCCLSECALSCSCKFAVLPASSSSGLTTVLAVGLVRTVAASMSPRVTSASARPSFLGNPRKTLHAYGFTRRTIHRRNRQPQCQRARSRPEGTSAPDTQSLVFALRFEKHPEPIPNTR